MMGVDGERSTSRAARRARRQSSRPYGRYLGFAVLGTLIPGIGMIAAGRRALGWTVLGAWLGAVTGVVLAAIRLGRGGLLSLASDSSAMRLIAPAILAIAVAWLLSAMLSLYLLQPAHMAGWKRLSGAVAVIAAATVVVTPLGLGAQYSNTHGNLIEKVFASNDQHSLTGPTEAPDVANPWADTPRVTVLLMGSDAGDGRDGVRPDTLIVASTDTRTGRTVLLSLPRNVQRVPFPDDSPLQELYSNGYIGFGDARNWMINAIYENVPAAHPEVFEGSSYPGADATKWAVEGALGIDVDYFVMVNLAGFEEVVDALGGITIDVHFRVPIGTKLDPRTGYCTPARDWIEPGLDQHLDGRRALWYARARCGPPPVTDDFNRMERQRCVIGAIAEEARPMNILRHYERLAGAAGDLIVTDIPQQMLPAFVDLAPMVQAASITSLAFTDDVITSRSHPDFDKIQALAAEAIVPPPGGQSSPSPGEDETPSSTRSPTTEPVTQEPGPADGGGTDGDPAHDPSTAQPLDSVC